MQKILNPNAIDIIGRQSEMIEYALTYKYDGLDIDLADMVARTNRTSLENATRFIKSANVNISGYDLAIDLGSDDIAFASALAKLPAQLDVAVSVGGDLAMVVLPAASDRISLAEFSETLTNRVKQLAELLAAKEQRLALRFSANKDAGKGKEHSMICTTEAFLSFFKGCTSANVGVMLESWHWTVGKGTVEHVKQIPAGKIFAFRAANIPAEMVAADATGNDMLLPFESETIDNAQFIDFLKSIGFEGPVSVAGSPLVIKGNKRESVAKQASLSSDRLISPETYVAPVEEEEEVEESAESAEDASDEENAEAPATTA